MNDFILSCCSTADSSNEHFEKRNIKYACFNYYINGVRYADDMGKTIPLEEFYKKMADGADTKTSQINIDEYYEYFEPFLIEGKDILHICLSSGLSGSYNSARIAASDLREKYPDRKIYIVDSLGASSGFGLLVDALADLRDEGKDIDYIYNWAEENKLRIHHWFFSTDLTFYVKGGRVSKMAGIFGTALKICPVLCVDANGKLVPKTKSRGKQNAIKEVLSRMLENADNGDKYSGKCFISHSACIDDATAVADLISGSFSKMDKNPEIYNIGTTIGSHTGPGTVAVFFWGRKREL